MLAPRVRAAEQGPRLATIDEGMEPWRCREDDGRWGTEADGGSGIAMWIRGGWVRVLGFLGDGEFYMVFVGLWFMG